jgi:predicted metalloprotease with PDZ domain
MVAGLFTPALPSRAQTGGVVMSVNVDVTDAPRRLLKSQQHIPAKPGPLTLLYPKWIPGEHSPSGPITDVAGLKISAAGKPIPWERDEIDMFAVHCIVPAGADGVDVALHYLAPPPGSGFTASASTSEKLAVLNWNQLLVYPKGPAARDIQCKASVRVPAGWKVGSALTLSKFQNNLAEYSPVSMEMLIDSPVLCGAHFRETPLITADGREHAIVIVCDSAAGLEMSSKVKENLDQLVLQAGKLFGGRHYNQYKFLVTLSDQVAHFGLEHHQSSDDRMTERIFIDDQIKKGGSAQLLPHEYTHSWNGKYRRPAGMVTETFQDAQKTKLLWVYEGLTEYLGVVLAARSGLWTPEQFRENLAMIALWAENQRGRDWRPLEDTAVAAQLLYYARSDWGAWRRSTDFYDEGILLWLDVDTLIREKTKGAKSLDDFCSLFCGGTAGPAEVKGYTFDDVVADLNKVVAHDWKGLLTTRLTSTDSKAPLKGIERGGWKLGFAAKPSDLQSTQEESGKSIDLTASIGATLSPEGSVTDVIPGSAAYKAGMGPNMKILAVNGRRWTATGLREAITAAKGSKDKIELLVENGDYFRVMPLDYHDGERYPILEREAGKEDLLTAICRPRV